MEAELQSLEDRIKTLAMLCRQLRDENQSLHAEIAVLRADKARLSEKIEVATQRIEAMLASLPAGEPV
ncbi:hypothetical protein [Chitinimonas lacunae]|uniref:TIGR02449 family protein n=1 Tax=Chitinimonas lacunae TaxID=1963018 RepID=A0ABV8MT62_9NEIS